MVLICSDAHSETSKILCSVYAIVIDHALADVWTSLDHRHYDVAATR